MELLHSVLLNNIEIPHNAFYTMHEVVTIK